MPKSKKSAAKKSVRSSSKSYDDKLGYFTVRLKAGQYSARGARIALTRMTNEGTLTADEAKTAERAYKKAFG